MGWGVFLFGRPYPQIQTKCSLTKEQKHFQWSWQFNCKTGRSLFWQAANQRIYLKEKKRGIFRKSLKIEWFIVFSTQSSITYNFGTRPNISRLSVINYFCKKFDLRCLMGIRISLCNFHWGFSITCVRCVWQIDASLLIRLWDTCEAVLEIFLTTEAPAFL